MKLLIKILQEIQFEKYFPLKENDTVIFNPTPDWSWTSEITLTYLGEISVPGLNPKYNQVFMDYDGRINRFSKEQVLHYFKIGKMKKMK